MRNRTIEAKRLGLLACGERFAVDKKGIVHFPGSTFVPEDWDEAPLPGSVAAGLDPTWVVVNETVFKTICRHNLFLMLEARAGFAALCGSTYEQIEAEVDRVTGGSAEIVCIWRADCSTFRARRFCDGKTIAECEILYPQKTLAALRELSTTAGVETAWEAL